MNLSGDIYKVDMLDSKGIEVQLGDKVLVAVSKNNLSLGVFEKVSKASFIIRIDGWAHSIARWRYDTNPLWDYHKYWNARQAGVDYGIERVIKSENDKPNKGILKVSDDFIM